MTTNQEYCRHFVSSNSIDIRDVKTLSRIIMELMQKHVKKDEIVEIKDLDHWFSDSVVVDFLFATISANSTKQLIMINQNFIYTILF